MATATVDPLRYKFIRTVEPVTKDQVDKLNKAQTEETFLGERDLRSSIKAIRQTIKNEEVRLRKRYKWLKHQNVIGLLAFVFSCISLVFFGYMYLKRRIHWGFVVPLMALPGSILHEIEHDLIHNLYFKSKQWVQHAMFFVIWWVKWSIPPWYRKMIHLRHHVVSGQRKDIEERLIGLGLPLNWLRWILTLNPFSVSLILSDIQKDNTKDWNKHKLVLAAFPTIIPFILLWHMLLSYIRLQLGWTMGAYDPVHYLPLWLWPYVRDASVLILLPNILRQACLNLMASYSHYYGDIPQNNVYYQNQIIDHWLLYPFQLFCFNFGSTHILHHFIPNQPFYLRQMLAKKAKEECVAHGIRRNDFGIIKRNNRYYKHDELAEEQRQKAESENEEAMLKLMHDAQQNGLDENVE